VSAVRTATGWGEVKLIFERGKLIAVVVATSYLPRTTE
jgi:hypothetical protein